MRAGFDFLVIGSQKAGTTALFEYLRRHARLILPAGKEAPFYSHDPIWEGGWERYAAHHFVRAPEDRLWGTVSPQYMWGAPYRPATVPAEPELVIPQRIAVHSPDVKLIAVLRDPVERAYSQHRMQLLNGWDARDFPQAVAELLEEPALEESRREPVETNSYVTIGEYGRILAPYFTLFGRERILTLFHRDMLSAPHAALRRVFGFLGVDETFVPDNVGKLYRVAASHRRIDWVNPNAFQARVAQMDALRAAWRKLPPHLRLRMHAGYRELGYRVDLANRVTAQVAQEHGALVEAKARLREHYAADRELLASLVGADLPW